MLMTIIRLLSQARSQITLTYHLLLDNRVPRWKKVIPFLPLLYVVSPLNLLTFAVPLLGQLDEVYLFVVAMQVFERMVDREIVAEYRAQTGRNRS
ncbi:MAG: hypothetical protein OHK0046_32070 [Anaerolineae bacterium]